MDKETTIKKAFDKWIQGKDKILPSITFAIGHFAEIIKEEDKLTEEKALRKAAALLLGYNEEHFGRDAKHPNKELHDLHTGRINRGLEDLIGRIKP